tara:strand:- start:444 stop:656 length:213 start_codon:yes stop_codon:yes gene_type:complete
MTNLQLASIISHAMYVGRVYGDHKDDLQFDERVFRNYARGMMNVLLREICLEDESAVEKALQDFFAMREI